MWILLLFIFLLTLVTLSTLMITRTLNRSDTVEKLGNTCSDNCNNIYQQCQTNVDDLELICESSAEDITEIDYCQDLYRPRYAQCTIQQIQCCGSCNGTTDSNYICAATDPLPPHQITCLYPPTAINRSMGQQYHVEYTDGTVSCNGEYGLMSDTIGQCQGAYDSATGNSLSCDQINRY